MLKKTTAYFLFLVFIAMASGGCGGGNDKVASPKDILPGMEFESSVVEIGENGKEIVLSKTMFEAKNLETSSKIQPAVLLFAKYTEEPDTNTGTMIKTAVDASLEDRTKIFLENHWDEYVDGKGDEGVDAVKFVEILEKYNVSLDTFLNVFEACDEDIAQTIFFLDAYSKKLYETEGYGVFDEIENFCYFSGSTLHDYIYESKRIFGSHNDFCDIVIGTGGFSNGGFIGKYITWSAENDSKNITRFFEYLKTGDFKKIQGDSPDPTKWGKFGLDVLKFGWDVIKDGKPQVSVDGAFTSVLKKDTTALDYGYAKRNETSIIHFKVTDAWIKSWTLIETKFRGSASYDARHPSQGGQYLQNVQFDVESAYAQWGMNLNVSAQVSNVTNSASPENPNPEIDVVARINAGWLFQSMGKSAYFRATGSDGIRFLRWGVD